jgi:tRNA-dihydrouridine synthase
MVGDSYEDQRAAEAAGVRLITIHGRTRQKFYKGRADWSAIRRVVQATNLPVIANGDCASLADARAMLEASGGVQRDTVRAIAETGVDRISIGSLTKDIRAVDYSLRVI